MAETKASWGPQAEVTHLGVKHPRREKEEMLFHQVPQWLVEAAPGFKLSRATICSRAKVS